MGIISRKNRIISRIATKTANYTATNQDEIIEVDSTSEVVIITLPSTGIDVGKKFIVTWVSGTNSVTIASPINLIDVDGISKASVIIANVDESYNYYKGSTVYQLF